MDKNIKHILILGCGYVGERLAIAGLHEGMQVSGTTRSAERAAKLRKKGITAILAASPADLPNALLAGVDAVVDSIPLAHDEQGLHAPQLAWLPRFADKTTRLKWAAYLSTTGVYGDAGGAWVDESSPCKPSIT
jgi:nucleoside-diphosphate-sugar epimerase